MDLENKLQRQLTAAIKKIEEQQAKIDRLMLEYCPDEITPEQFDEFENHQKAVKKEPLAALNEINIEQCSLCRKEYETVYRVPNHIWLQICPNPQTLGPHYEHMGGGLLCVDCAWTEAKDKGTTLYFDASESDWPENEIKNLKELVIKAFLSKLSVDEIAYCLHLQEEI